MNNITLPGAGEKVVVFDVRLLQKKLEMVADARKARGKRYPLPVLLTMVLLAKLAGEQTPTGIAEWLRLRRRQLVRFFACKHPRVPSLNTIRRVLRQEGVRRSLHTVLRQFLQQQYGGQQSVLVAIDGKTLRGTIAKGETQGVHLLAAYLPAEGVTLLQLPVSSKQNELVVAPRLLSALDLKGRIVCGDAMFTQRTLSVQIQSQGGDYIWPVKDNQEALKADVAQFFVPPRRKPGWHTPKLPETVACRVELNRDRLERRTLRLVPDESGFLDWPGVEQVFQLQRRVIEKATGVIREETVYGITSLPPPKLTAKELLAATQEYWGIENGLHYRRDVSLQEDSLRMVHEAQAEVTATLNSFIVGLMSKLGFSNLASFQRRFEAKLTLALGTLG